MKTSPTLIVIPDISGFTKFMSNTNFELSSKVIPSLLNQIIYSNEINLKISEIEGDAVLFYRKGELPPFKTLVNQCRYFYTEFYSKLRALKEKHSKDEGVENIPEILGLKIVLHYGMEIGAVPIGKSIKLMGEDVILAHRLLKNEVPCEEYLLLSENLLKQYNGDIVEKNFGWGQLHKHETEYKHIGEVNYSYINLEPLVY